MQSREYDAIVVGSGISGGWAAKELTEKGLRVLLLERGRNIEVMLSPFARGLSPAFCDSSALPRWANAPGDQPDH
jgi:choline dehydrogenase-like flavoprotein